MKPTYYLIDTSSWICLTINTTMSDKDVAAKNAGYMHANDTLRWYHGNEISHLPIVWTRSNIKDTNVSH